mgnify:FL=1
MVIELSEDELAEKKAADRRKFVKNHCTNLIFQFKDDSKVEKLMEGVRFERYTDIQRAVAQVMPKSLKVFLIQHENGKLLTPEDFVESHTYRVKEMTNAKLEATSKSKFRPQVDPRWEFYDYHAGPPPNWVDPIEVAKKKKEDAIRAAKEREKQDLIASKMMDRIGGDDSDSEESDGGAFDD